MIQRYINMLSRIFLLMIFLLGKRVILSNEEHLHLVEAFSTLSRSTRPTRIRNIDIQTSVKTKQPRTTTVGFSSSLHAWRMPFGSTSNVPTIGKDGLYHITTEEEYRSLMEANPDKIVVLKVFSPWCKSCKALAPKFQALAHRLDKDLSNLPILWISLAYSKENRHLVRGELGVNAVPYILLYAGDGELVDSFRCGPSKVGSILRPKLADLIADHVDLSTGKLKESGMATKTLSSMPQPSTDKWDEQSSPSNGPLKMFAQRFFKHEDLRPTNGTITKSL